MKDILKGICITAVGGVVVAGLILAKNILIVAHRQTVREARQSAEDQLHYQVTTANSNGFRAGVIWLARKFDEGNVLRGPLDARGDVSNCVFVSLVTNVTVAGLSIQEATNIKVTECQFFMEDANRTSVGIQFGDPFETQINNVLMRGGAAFNFGEETPKP